MKQWLFAATVSIFSTVLSAQNISSTFDFNNEGWTVANFNRTFGTVVSIASPTYQGTGGSPTGCISKYEASLSFGGQTLFFVAPAKFRGNKKWAYGKNLSFDIRSQRDLTDSNVRPFSEDNVVIEGGGSALFFNIPTPPITWTHIDCPIIEGSWLLGSRNGRPASKAEIQNVLCNITRLWIRCEYTLGADEGFLDNVTLEMEPPCFTTNNQNLTLCNGQSISLNNKTYNTTGIYTDTIKNPNPCSLLCDSIVRLTLNVLDPITTLIDTTICEGSFVKIGNNIYNQSGSYKDILSSASNCDSTITTRLTVITPIRLPQNFTICQGDMIRVGIKTYNRTGTFIDTFKNRRGCDSFIITTNLLVNAPSLKSQNLTICQGNFIQVGNKTYNRAGVFIDTLKNFNQCDSIITTTLKVNPISLKSQSFTICQGDFIKVGNKTYNQTGIFIDTLKNFTNCDSIITTTLKVNPISLKSQNFTICPGGFIKVGSKTYNQAGVFIDTLKNFTNCDSIITTTLIINPISVKSQNLKICQGDFIRVGSKTYNRTGIFIDTLKNFTNCDSIITTTLTVNTPTFKTQNIRICQGNSIKVGSKTYNKTGIFTDTLRNFTNCDSIVTTNLTILPPPSISQNLSVCEGDFIKISTRMYNQTGIFKDTLQTASGCDSIVTTTLTVNKRYALTQNVSICPTSSFTVGNKTYSQAGTYRDTLHSLQRCDSVITTVLTIKTTATRTQTLAFCKGQSLKVGAKIYTQTGIYRDTFRASSGCDSVVVTDLIVNLPTSKQQNLTICQGETVKIGGKTYTQSGVFKDTLQNFTQCDSVITTNLTVIPPLSISQNLMICEGDFIKIGTKTYNKTGIFRDTLRALSGCDSVVTTTLKVNTRYNRTQNVTICPTGSYRINFKNYTQAGTYRDTLFTRDHCDSVVTTVLSVQNAITYTQDITFCNGNTLKIGSKMYSRTGTYRDTIRSFSGCDSVITTNLTVHIPSFKTFNITICQGESFTVSNKTYTQSGIFTEVLKNFNNCDSTITTKLTVIPPLSKSQNLSICAGDFIKIGVKTYNKTGIFKDTLKSFTGCDSIVTTHLTVNAVYSKSQNLTICEGSSIKVGNKIYTRTGIFNDTLKTITGCDSILTTNLGVYAVFVSSQSLEICEGGFIKVGNKTYNKSGIFSDTLTSKLGCDSLIFTILKVNTHISRTQTVSICPNTALKIGTHTYTLSGTYRDTLKTIFGCDSLVTTVLKVQPVASFIQNIALCSGQTFKMGSRTYMQTGVYRDTLRTQTGCDSLVTTHLTINSIIFKSQNLTICEGEYVKAGARIYVHSGTFKDTLKALGGCDSIVTTTITVLPLSIRRIDTTICGNKNLVINNKSYTQTGLFKQAIARIGKCDSVVQISLTVIPLTFKRNDITLCPNDTIFINGRVLKQAGVYRDTVAAAVGCPQIVETNVKNSSLRISAGADITLEVGDSTRLSPAIPTGTNVLWHWQANKALSCVDCPNPIIKPLETTVFRVEATDTASDCTVRDDIRVIVKSCTSLFLPTSFSPNDDGHNDYFTLFAAGCVRSVKKMMVFNRWGALIFSKENFLPNNEQDGWDGTFQGKALPSDVYTYLLELEVGNGKIEKVWGDVTLMK